MDQTKQVDWNQLDVEALKAIAITGLESSITALETIGNKKLDDTKSSFELFAKIATDSKNEDVAIKAVKMLQNLKLEFYPSELIKRRILCGLAQSCQNEKVALLALQSLFEESKRDYNLEDKRLFAGTAVHTQSSDVATAAVEHLKELFNIKKEEDKQMGLNIFWDIHTNTKWIFAGYNSFKFLIEKNFFNETTFHNWRSYQAFFNKFDSKT